MASANASGAQLYVLVAIGECRLTGVGQLVEAAVRRRADLRDEAVIQQRRRPGVKIISVAVELEGEVHRDIAAVLESGQRLEVRWLDRFTSIEACCRYEYHQYISAR